jgi:hypothetical protein
MSVSRKDVIAGTAATFATIGFIKPASAAEFAYKWAVDVPPDHPISTRSVEAFNRIKSATNGRVEIKAFPSSQLGSDPAMLSQLRTGALEMLALPGAFLNSVVPVASIENVAYAFPTRETAFKAMDGDLGQVIRADIMAKDMFVFDKIWENGFREITTSTKPIHVVGDLAGLKIRVSPGKIRIDTFARRRAHAHFAQRTLHLAANARRRRRREPADPDRAAEVLRSSKVRLPLQPHLVGLLDADEYRLLEEAAAQHPSDFHARDERGGGARPRRQRAPQRVGPGQVEPARHEIQSGRSRGLSGQTGRREVLRSLEDRIRPESLGGTRALREQTRVAARVARRRSQRG